MDIKEIGIAGAGLMGGGIAQMFAEHGFAVKLWDMDATAINKGMAQIKKRLDRGVEKGGITAEQRAAILNNITPVAGVDGLSGAGFVLEAIIENLRIKQNLFRELEATATSACIFATNTSSLSVTEISKSLRDRRRFLGAHFFNPPTKLALLEVIPTSETSNPTLTSVEALARACGKTPVRVKDSPGFIVNRLLLLLINEAAHMLDAGVATPEDIDAAMNLGALHPAGPLAVADLIGLDTCKRILDTLHAQLGNESFKTASCIAKLVDEGKLGRKSGEGFFKIGKEMAHKA